ncbi:MAG: NrfD/PsrC family molybdoenzyme membrane anchor subunit [Candidatus Longimicrobiales bacterium M2_2A_002]
MTDRLTYLKTALWTLVGVLAAVTVVRFTRGLGAVTDLSDATPWGLWIGFDVMSGVALAAGGFVIAGAVYIFGLERYRPFVRAAILTALLGYAAVAVGLLYDLGLPWRIWHPLVHWQYHSVLFEVALCVMLYLTVLALEFAPVVLEHPRFDRPVFRALLRGLRKISIVLVIAGIVLSTLHQSSLGSLFLITPDRLHPLWYSHSIYVQFLISAVALGLATVVLEALFSRYFLGHEVHVRELGGLGLAASVVLVLYLALRLGDLGVRGILPMALDGTWQANLFLFEIGLGAVVPAVLFLIPVVRERVAGVGIASGMVVLGIIGHRLDVSIVAFARPEGMAYFPTWEEIAVSLGIVAGAMLIFLWFVENLRVFDDVHGPPPAPEPRFEPATVRDLMAPGHALPRRYTLAVLAGAALALPFLPLGGPVQREAHTRPPRWVEGAVTTDAEGAPRVGLADFVPARETRLLLLIDGNRDGELALFDHDAHEERVDGECAVCHHLNLPLDRGSSCSECHRDMYAPTRLFDHEAHEAALGGAASCVECHAGAAVKSYAAATACSDCHEADRAPAPIVDPPADHWADAVGYMEALHGLCVECHERALAGSPDAYPADLAECATCHDPDRRDQLRQLEPRKRMPSSLRTGGGLGP